MYIVLFTRDFSNIYDGNSGLLNVNHRNERTRYLFDDSKENSYTACIYVSECIECGCCVHVI